MIARPFSIGAAGAVKDGAASADQRCFGLARSFITINAQKTADAAANRPYTAIPDAIQNMPNSINDKALMKAVI